MWLKISLASFKRHAALVMVVLALMVVLLLVAFLWAWPSWQAIREISVIKDRVPLETELVKVIAQIVLGILVIGTLWIAWRRATAAEQTVKVAQEGQITERFTRAVEQLGNRESMAIRLGGIYALERIAKDSPKDHWQVMEVLTAYVRENSQWGKHTMRKQRYREVPSDIQAILTVIGRRNAKCEEKEQKLDLTYTDLRGVILLGANFQRANFESANLERARLGGANLQGADFPKANLKNATLVKANLKGANLLTALNLCKGQIKFAFTDKETKLPFCCK